MNNRAMTTMTYRGFIGSVSFSKRDNLYFGKIENIDGLVNYEAPTVADLHAAFHKAVDYYINYLKRDNE